LRDGIVGRGAWLRLSSGGAFAREVRTRVLPYSQYAVLLCYPPPLPLFAASSAAIDATAVVSLRFAFAMLL